MNKIEKTVLLNHLTYEVVLIYAKNKKTLNDLIYKYKAEDENDFIAYCVHQFNEKQGRNRTVMVFNCHPKEDITVLVHELTHVLQNICKCYGINFEKETEHMGYIMQYLTAEFLGYELYTKK